MRVLAIAAALTLLVSAAHAAATDVAAPAPDGATVIAASQDGGSIKATIGEVLAVELIGAPSAGASWSVAAQPDFLTGPERKTGPTTQAQMRPGFVGGQRWQVFVFTVNAAGSGALRLEQISAANREGPPLASFELTIETE